MKKYYFLIIVTLILGLVLTGCSLLSNVGQVPTSEQSGISYSTKGTLANPDVFTLYAGQHIDIGTVEVWNDTDNLYVKYVVNNPWCLTETHLHVADLLENIPQTKKGNPIPGQFDYKGEHDCELDFLYTIPLAGLSIELCIAAHAVVANTSITMEEVVVSRPGIDAYGPLDVYANLGDLSWGFANPAVATWVHSLWPSIPGAIWISTDDLVENPDINSWRWFHDEINLPEKGYYISGDLVTATADNEEEVYLNGVLIGSNNNWASITNYPISPQPGVNTLDFIVFNWAWTGGVYANPTGLIYKATATYYPEESAWAAIFDEPGEIGFSGKNWATYFMYNLEEIFIENVEVFPYSAVHCSSAILETGKKYRLDVSGTYVYWSSKLPDAGTADAKYSLRPEGSFNAGPGSQWINGDDLVGYENYLELWVNGSSQNWIGNYTNHIYSMEYDGDGSHICFSILDSGYSDNSGSLPVDITWIP